jgi:hypothetical protein
MNYLSDLMLITTSKKRLFYCVCGVFLISGLTHSFYEKPIDLSFFIVTTIGLIPALLTSLWLNKKYFLNESR